jgi:hypothetical protein
MSTLPALGSAPSSMLCPISAQHLHPFIPACAVPVCPRSGSPGRGRIFDALLSRSYRLHAGSPYQNLRPLEAGPRSPRPGAGPLPYPMPRSPGTAKKRPAWAGLRHQSMLSRSLIMYGIQFSAARVQSRTQAPREGDHLKPFFLRTRRRSSLGLPGKISIKRFSALSRR